MAKSCTNKGLFLPEEMITAIDTYPKEAHIDRLENEKCSLLGSKKGVTLHCSLENNRVKLSGKATLYSIADIFIYSF